MANFFKEAEQFLRIGREAATFEGRYSRYHDIYALNKSIAKWDQLINSRLHMVEYVKIDIRDRLLRVIRIRYERLRELNDIDYLIRMLRENIESVSKKSPKLIIY